MAPSLVLGLVALAVASGRPTAHAARLRRAAAEQTAPVGSPGVAGAATTSRDNQPRAAELARRSGLGRAWFWTAAGLSTALLATSAVTGVMAWRKSSRFNDPATPDSSLRSLESDGTALRTAATLTFGAGIAALTSTLVLLFVTDPGDRDSGGAAAPVAVAPLPGGALLWMGCGF